MIGKFLYGACAAALVATTAVMAEPSNVTSNVTDAKSDPHRQICRSTADTGTRLGRTRECHTAQEWEEIHRRRGQDIDHYQEGH
jgi:hypothetical protein